MEFGFKDCADDFVIEALEYENAFDIT